MPADASIVADPANGLAFVAGRPIAMESRDAGGAIRFGGAGGTQLRPLAYAERTEIVMSAASRDAVAAAVLAAATVEAGAGDRALLEVLALWLAGAAWDAPPFAETTLRVARASGWPPEQLFSAPATEVDRLAVYLDEHRRDDDGWNTIVFADAPCEDVSAVRARYADRLLQRGSAAASESASEGFASSHGSSPVLAFRSNTQDGGTRLLRGDDATFGMRTARTFDQGRVSVPPRSDVDGWGASAQQDDAGSDVCGIGDSSCHGPQTFTRPETPAAHQTLAVGTSVPVEDRRPRLSVLASTGAQAFGPDLGSGNGNASASDSGKADRRGRLSSTGTGTGTGTGGTRTRVSVAAREPLFAHEAAEESSAATVHAFALPSFLKTPEPQPEPAQVRADAFDVASAMAALLDDEADLRGVTR